MKSMAICLMVIAGITGLAAAYFWMRSAMVPIDAPGSFEPIDEADKANFWNTGIMIAFQKSAAFNKTAAALTAVSVMLGSIASIIGALGY